RGRGVHAPAAALRRRVDVRAALRRRRVRRDARAGLGRRAAVALTALAAEDRLMTDLLATYRLQLGGGFGFAQARELVPYLRDLGADHVWVEKIVDPGEKLRAWPVDGTVGYEFLNDVAALFVDPAGEAELTALWHEVSGDGRPFSEYADEAKLEMARTTFSL